MALHWGLTGDSALGLTKGLGDSKGPSPCPGLPGAGSPHPLLQALLASLEKEISQARK